AMSAVRLARAVTGRPKLLKFAGGYHGHADSLLVDAGSGVATLGIPATPGVTAGTSQDTLVTRFNSLADVEMALAQWPGQVAAVIVEPVAGNMGVVPPEPDFLEGLRRLTRDEGSLLIFDEVITGFRLARGGAQELYGVAPDLTCLGKVLGGGLPIGAYGGRRDADPVLHQPPGPRLRHRETGRRRAVWLLVSPAPAKRRVAPAVAIRSQLRLDRARRGGSGIFRNPSCRKFR